MPALRPPLFLLRQRPPRRPALQPVALLALCAWGLGETLALWRTRRLRQLDLRSPSRAEGARLPR